MHHPKRDIDAFMELHHGEYERTTDDKCYQMILKKTSEIRIGFLSKEVEMRSQVDLNTIFEYGINIALTVDSSYAMPAAVAIRSVVDNTPGRITFYILDTGLNEGEQEKIKDSIPEMSDVTINYLFLPTNSLTTKIGMGQMWSKIDLLSILPVERVLYLDADIIVRKDLHDLWNMDLDGKPIAAVPDVDIPNGHTGPNMTGFPAPYFNAGVLLVDLTKVRMTLSELFSLSEQSKNSKFKDQDALNVHFINSWKILSLNWNAQGLGTYASTPSPDRVHLQLSEMLDPAIIHFTGPVHPPLVDILNPYVQPFTSKPWGYAGAPGHPYADEWWRILEMTSWKSWIDSSERKDCYEQKHDFAKMKAIKDFEMAIMKDSA